MATPASYRVSPRRRDILRWASGLALTGIAASSPGSDDRADRFDEHSDEHFDEGAAPAARASELQARRLAWAGVRLALPDSVLYIDPLANPDVWGPALPDPLPRFENDPGNRFALVTHLHPDHFDAASVQRILGDSGTLLCEASVAANAASRGVRVRAARLFEPQWLGDFLVTAVPAVDGYGDTQVSWVVAGGGRRMFHGGDTLWHGHWWQIGRQLGPFDAAFLPINGARFRWRQPAAELPSVLTAEQAVAAALILGARSLIPIHYGVSGAQGYAEEPDAPARVVAEGRRRGVDVQLIPPGVAVRWPTS
jgi:L-ascorbate metabolism protein UlaG (beta-lactamase superfamily)